MVGFGFAISPIDVFEPIPIILIDSASNPFPEAGVVVAAGGEVTIAVGTTVAAGLVGTGVEVEAGSGVDVGGLVPGGGFVGGGFVGGGFVPGGLVGFGPPVLPAIV